MSYLLIIFVLLLSLPNAEDLDAKKLDYAHKIRRMNKSLSGHVEDVLKTRYKLMFLKQLNKKIPKRRKEHASTLVAEHVKDQQKSENLQNQL